MACDKVRPVLRSSRPTLEKDQTLVVPPEVLSRLPPKQVSHVLGLEAANNERAFAYSMAKVIEESKARRQMTWLGFVVLLAVLAVVALTAYRGDYEWTLKLLMPLVTGVAGYLAGKPRGD